MNESGEIVYLPTPRTILLLAAAFYTNDTDLLGNEAIILSATDAKFFDKEVDNDIYTTAKFRSAAKIHFIQMNTITNTAMKVLSSKAKAADSDEVEKKEQLCAKLSREFQQQLFGMGAGAEVTNKSPWLAKFIQGAVTQHDYEAHLRNLQHEIMKRLAINLDVVSRREAWAIAQTVHLLKVAFEEHKTEYLKLISHNIVYADSSKATPIESHPKQKAYLQTLMGQVQAIILPAQDVRDQTEIPPIVPYYSEMSTVAIADFWSLYWNADTCLSLYRPFSDFLALERMRNDKEGMADFMLSTWVNICHDSWTHVLLPRLENWISIGKRFMAGPHERAMRKVNVKEPYNGLRELNTAEGYEKRTFDHIFVMNKAHRRGKRPGGDADTPTRRAPGRMILSQDD